MSLGFIEPILARGSKILYKRVKLGIVLEEPGIRNGVKRYGYTQREVVDHPKTMRKGQGC